MSRCCVSVRERACVRTCVRACVCVLAFVLVRACVRAYRGVYVCVAAKRSLVWLLHLSSTRTVHSPHARSLLLGTADVRLATPCAQPPPSPRAPCSLTPEPARLTLPLLATPLAAVFIRPASRVVADNCQTSRALHLIQTRLNLEAFRSRPTRTLTQMKAGLLCSTDQMPS